MKIRIACALLALPLAASLAHAAPHVWLDTDRGPIVLELDAVRAPATSAHFLDAVGDGFYDGLVFHRTIKDFVIQAGRVDGEGKVRTRSPNPTVVSERNNALAHVPGAISIALPSANGAPLYDAGTTEFFIDTARNTTLDGQYTVFGQVVHGMPVVDAIGDGITYTSQMPFRPALIRRAIASDGFPVMPLHSGAWYDPANSGRGISLEVSTVAGGDGTPLMVAYWYDYQGGRQVWMNGAAPFEYGDTEVTIELAITDGGEFGEAYDPALVDVDGGFGTLTVRFSGCDAGSFHYDTAFGSGSMALVRITIPDGQSCD